MNLVSGGMSNQDIISVEKVKTDLLKYIDRFRIAVVEGLE